MHSFIHVFFLQMFTKLLHHPSSVLGLLLKMKEEALSILGLQAESREVQPGSSRRCWRWYPGCQWESRHRPLTSSARGGQCSVGSYPKPHPSKYVGIHAEKPMMMDASGGQNSHPQSEKTRRVWGTMAFFCPS